MGEEKVGGRVEERATRDWTLLCLLGLSVFVFTTAIRMVWDEPFPSVTFPAFSSPPPLETSRPTLWLITPDDTTRWSQDDFRGGFEAALVSRLEAESAAEGVSVEQVTWLVASQTIDAFCGIEVRTSTAETELQLSSGANALKAVACG